MSNFEKIGFIRIRMNMTATENEELFKVQPRFLNNGSGISEIE